MKQRSTFTFILFLALLMPVVSMAGEVVIVVNGNVPATTLAQSDVKQIFLGQKTTWDNGDKITFVVQDGTETNDAFLKTYVQKSSSQYDNYWKKQVFTGKGKAPKSFSSEQDLIQFVSQTPGAIGFTSSDADTGNAKIITVQ